jgi:putative transposase
MPNYRRMYVAGGTYFFTIVTQSRRPFLTGNLSRKLLHEAIETQLRRRPFEITAMVLLPDHLHAVWTLPHGDSDYSTRWRLIKGQFTEQYLAAGGTEGSPTKSQFERGERGIWQPRFWEHTVRDEVDLERCVDYVHWNPVKHGLVKRVRDYPWSTFHRFVHEGFYSLEWGDGEVITDVVGAEWD